MVPSRFNFVRTLPFVSSGKVDYQALFNLHVNELAKTDFSDVGASSLTNRIKRAFKLVLKLDYISIDDDFFSLGGTSISAAHLAHILAIDMRLLYTHSTIIELESALRALQKETEGSLAPNLDDGLPDSRSLKRVKKDLTPNATHSGVSSCCTEQSVSRESSSFRHAVENDSWPYAHMGDAPVAFLRCNACMPKEVCLSAHDLFLEPCSMKDLGTLGILWKSHLKACVDASPVLMCSQGVCLVFIGSHAHNFLCIDAYNGNVVWERQLGDRVESTAALTSDFKHVIVGSYDGYLYIFETGTGILKWSFQTKAEVKCQPTVDGRGLVWCGSHDHHIYALNVLEQRSDWELDCKASIFAAAAHDSTRFLTYIATTAGTIMAFSTESSHPRATWTYVCGAPIFGSLAVDAASGYLICTLVNGKVLAFMPGGAIAWEYTCVGPVFAGATLTTALPSQVIVCSRDGWVYFLHLNSGKCLWKYCLGEPITSSAYVDESLNLVIKESDDDTMYSHNYRLVCACGSSGHVHVLKIYAGSTSSSCSSVVKDFSTRNDLSRIPFPDGNQSNGSMSGSKAGDKEGGASKTEYRDCLTVGGCEFVAVLKLPGDIFSSPVMLGGRIFVGCRDDYLYCLEISGLGLHEKEFTNLCSSTTTE